MKKKNINNFYTDEDLVNFDKLKNFKNVKFNKINTSQKSHPQRYAKPDSENFEKIISFNNKSLSKDIEKQEKKDNYYKSLDIENFEKIKKTFTYDNDKPSEKEIDPKKVIINYTDNDKKAFDQIIKTNYEKNHKVKNINTKVDKAKIKIIDFDKLNKREKNLKNNVGIEKIKIVYFD